VAAAALIGMAVARALFDTALPPPWWPLLAGGAAGVLLSVLAGLLGTRRILHTPPALALREA
jgi:putative ABC transport system permease protein